VVLVLVSGGGLVMGVACYLTGAVFRLLVMRLVLRRLASWITFGWRHATWQTVKEFTLPSLAFMAFPLGQAMGLQGTLIVIGAMIGPAAVVVFNTVRMLSRYTVHLTVIFARVGSPEIAFAYGQGNRTLVRQIHWQLCRLGVWAAFFACSLLALATPWILDIWTGGRIAAEPALYLPLLAAVLVWAMHTLIANVLQATNQHRRLALAFLGISLLGLALTVLTTWIWNLPGAAVAGLAAELVLLTYALPGATRMTGGTIGQFLRHLAIPPSPAMLRHLKAKAAG
jgi:O-antigen/teichoic acid export membrane protein